MEQERFQVLEDVMAAAAEGDSAAVFRLYEEFGGALSAALRRHLRHFGVSRIDRADLDGLVLDAAVALFDCARSWRPESGTPPWVWARARLADIAARWIGAHADRWTEEVEETLVDDWRVAPAPGPAAEPPPAAVLAALAAGRSDVQLVAEALDRLPARTRAILLEVRLQAALGDPSPAVTVAGDHGLRPDHVRQLAKRGRDRLRDLAATEPRFAVLAGLPLVAA